MQMSSKGFWSNQKPKTILYRHHCLHTAVVLALGLPMTSHATDKTVPTTPSTTAQQPADALANVVLLTPSQLEAKLQSISVDDMLNQDQEMWQDKTETVADFVANGANSAEGADDHERISRLDDVAAPIGLDTHAITQLPNLQGDDATEQLINPNVYIPEYQYQPEDDVEVSTEVAKAPKPNLAKRLYNRLFKDGVESVPKLKVDITLTDIGSSDAQKISRQQQKTEPFANMKSALEDITVESVSDFKSALPRLRQTAQAAARAVGYYDVDIFITQKTADTIELAITRLGEPVRIDNQVLEVRGDGANDDGYQQAIATANLQAGNVFHHGRYETAKSLVQDASVEHGYFDGKWLNHSADVILPDNIADVSLVYESGQQYTFDDVVFFTFDPDTGQMTTDPDKLPVKPELLKKLLTFETGDAYSRAATRQLSNDLLATRYFNVVNTETIFPNATGQNQDGVNFENTQKPDDEPIAEESAVLDLGDGVVATVAPIEFSTSQVIQDKLDLVAQKASRLYSLPDDRLLIEESQSKSTNLLGKISDAVSNVAKLIFPDDASDTFLGLPAGESLPTLQGKKTDQQVYQDKKVPLYVFVATDKPRDAQIGIGWGSDSGVRLITKAEHKLINRKGYQAGVDVRLSQNKRGASIFATRPMTHPLNDKLRASISYEEEKLGSGASFGLSSKTLQQSIGRNIVNKNGWNRNYWLRYRLDELKTDTPSAVWEDLPVKFINGKPIQQAVLAGASVSKTVSDNVVNPMQGYRQQYSLEAGVKGLATDANMVIARANVSGVMSFGDNAYGKNRAHQLIGGLQAGYLWTDDFDSVPYKLRFFAGGDQSVRGYNHDSLAPLSDKGYLMGGQALAVGSVEYNYEVLEGLRLATFADVGGAYDRSFKTPTKVGAGVGLRWASPVGQVRVDIATGVKEKDRPIKLHFFIGTPF